METEKERQQYLAIHKTENGKSHTHTSREAISPDLVELAGAGALAIRAREHLAEGRPLQAIHLAEVVTDTDPGHAEARAVLAAAHEALLSASTNFWETAWLRHQIDQIERYS